MKDWHIGWIEEIPGVNVQEKTIEEAKESLREALAFVLEANRALTKRDAGRGKVVREVVRIK
jgi:predicted RNase H-like HicB family nuclease